MRSRVRRVERSLTDEELNSILQKEYDEERLSRVLENVPLKDVPLEVRRNEAKRPLYLTRYE